MEKYHDLLFHRTLRAFPELSLTLYGCPLFVVCEVRFLGRIFDESLIWFPYLRLPCQSPFDPLRHLSHTTWGADMSTLLRLYLVLVRSKFGPNLKRGSAPGDWCISFFFYN